jgi:Mg2+ and Co2+ transporter CorA
MAKASDKYRNWFESDKLVSDLMDQAADDIDERDAEIERLREALKKMQRSRDRYRQAWESEKTRLTTLQKERGDESYQ